MKIFKYIAIGLLTTNVLSSCDLDLYPYDVIETSQSFNSVGDAKNWSERLHADLRGRVYGHYIMSTDIQSDQLNATADYGNNYGDVHRWTLLSDNYQIRDYYQGYYSALNNVNMTIEGFKNITPKDDTETKALKEYTGVAHFARAYYYFMLNIRFAKAYNASSASTDLSVPLVLVPDINATPARSTVKEVYDQILSDISIAKTNLAEKAGATNAKQINLDVVIALESRVKLYMQDWNGAKQAAETLINSGKYNLYTTAEGVKNMWHNDAGNEVIFAPFVSINEGPNVNNIYIGWNAGTSRYTPMYLPSQWIIDSYSDSDFRKGAYFLTSPKVYMASKGKEFTGTIVNKYPGNPALRNAGAVTNYAHSPKVFRIAEAYLNAAEASFRALNEGVARTHLNTLRASRGLTALASTVSGTALLNEIKLERLREFAFEGFRLEDLKRWGDGFTRRNPQDTEMLQTGADFTTKSVSANDDKITWGIPDRDVVANPNIVQNPGW
ncbi:RagB/SusD family nutrient uptake outer membrane protein [Sphingobacterium litopenaei]|uniref:RagB/SusD family nutrient uptake outer membrane protein n=1 Tax=Sphingobacterium litopenaei TaxID=2763500 RepID=A0ABR7YAA3_9SPHI|nr:RagB/SusD family nutrient uptake outer membrane protein [Sphingobacterium litopenaei]MBD1428221.1 RagB/SusD family nutrient uptake outer membrane protein [Sphingobacterium litopenaei]